MRTSRAAVRILSAIVCFPAICGAQVAAPSAVAPEPIDDAAIELLRTHGLEQSQVMQHLSWLCDVYGPRLTNSPNHRAAAQWAVQTFSEWELSNARIEPFGPFGTGWRLDHFHCAVVGDNPWSVVAYPKAWCPSLDGRVVAQVVDVSGLSADQLRAMDLSDKFVMIEGPREVSEPFDGQARRLDVEDLWQLATGASASGARAARAQEPPRATFRRGDAQFDIVWEKRPLAILDRFHKGDYGTVFATGVRVVAPPGAQGARPRGWDTQGVDVVPQITLAVEHYNRIGRLLEKGQSVSLAIELRASFFDEDPMAPNVVAELPGVDPELGQQVVMLGAHLDSWHTATGATDNGCGSAVMMEAARLLSLLVAQRGQGPRRTIRVALWGGEEQGLIGSRAWVARHLATPGERGAKPVSTMPAHGLMSAYYNLDNGTGRIRGVYLQGNEAVASIFRAWLRPFHDLDAATLTLSNTGGTDHLAFDAVGVPGFQFIQDPVAYSPRTHHSSMDNWDHAIAADLQQAATIIAAFAWHTAQRDQMLPRKP